MPYCTKNNKVIPITLPNAMHAALKAQAAAEPYGATTGAMTKILRRRSEVVEQLPPEVRELARQLAPPGETEESVYPLLMSIGADLIRGMEEAGTIRIPARAEPG